ncbi:MAG: Fic family protein [Mariprofundus sp.]
MFKPTYTITSGITKALMDIEASRQVVSSLPITLSVLHSLRESARLSSTHYSTQIEGNRLTRQQVDTVINGGVFPNRERDEKEVRNYYASLDYVDTLLKHGSSEKISERWIQTIHSLVMEGRKQPDAYRDGQNVIRDSVSGRIVYMPPEAKDVAALMHELLDWVNNEKEIPAPMLAAIAHYQFATIHPYYDGNGRTARLLTNLILHRSGYGLKGIYSLEEYYARDLQAYYDGLTIGESHNYYFGRVDADITGWIAYFCSAMADAFANVRTKATEAAATSAHDQTRQLRQLDLRQQQVLALFRQSRFVTTKEIATLLGLHTRTALNLCNQWIEHGFLIRHGESNKLRKYELAEQWHDLLR